MYSHIMTETHYYIKILHLCQENVDSIFVIKVRDTVVSGAYQAPNYKNIQDNFFLYILLLLACWEIYFEDTTRFTLVITIIYEDVTCYCCLR